MAMRNDRRQAVWDKTAGHCWYCGHLLCDDDELKSFWSQHAGPDGIESKAARFLNSIEMQIDHAEARARGGTDAISNLHPACFSCNSEKGAKSVEEYRIALMLNRSRAPTPFHGERDAGLARDWLIVASPVRSRDLSKLRPFLGHHADGAVG